MSLSLENIKGRMMVSAESDDVSSLSLDDCGDGDLWSVYCFGKDLLDTAIYSRSYNFLSYMYYIAIVMDILRYDPLHDNLLRDEISYLVLKKSLEIGASDVAIAFLPYVGSGLNFAVLEYIQDSKFPIGERISVCEMALSVTSFNVASVMLLGDYKKLLEQVV